jgi:hypothetical protein
VRRDRFLLSCGRVDANRPMVPPCSSPRSGCSKVHADAGDIRLEE